MLVKPVFGMAKTNILLSVLLLVIAVHATSAFYCHRLVPRFITHAVTPCTYPCLVVSSHVQPHIVVQNEQDGTPCMIHSGFHHKVELGTCRGAICTQDLHHKVLKRKKRLVLLYAIPRIFTLRRQSRKLQNKIDQLKAQLARNSHPGVESEDENQFQDYGSAGLGVGNNGMNTGEALGPDYGGGLEGGPRNLDMSEGGRGILRTNQVSSYGFGDRNNEGIETAASRYLSNRNNDGGSLGTAGPGTEEDLGFGQMKLG